MDHESIVDINKAVQRAHHAASCQLLWQKMAEISVPGEIQ